MGGYPGGRPARLGGPHCARSDAVKDWACAPPKRRAQDRTRAAVIAEVSRDYVTAARVSGAGTLRLMFREVLPNCAAPLIVQASLGISTAILDAAACAC